jgi:hypothetical protein
VQTFLKLPPGGIVLRPLIIVLAASIACLSGCAGLELNPLINEPRHVHFELDSSKSLTVIHEMVWDDKSHATHELRFPPGIYSLEAEDEDYWYMRSRAPLTLIEFRKGGQAESRSLRGGIALGKYITRAVPAAGYIDGEEASRVLIWKLGKDFLGREGTDWRKSF